MPKPGGAIWVKAIAEDGSFGLGRTDLDARLLDDLIPEDWLREV